MQLCMNFSPPASVVVVPQMSTIEYMKDAHKY